jgi:hypothetical protein
MWIIFDHKNLYVTKENTDFRNQVLIIQSCNSSNDINYWIWDKLYKTLTSDVSSNRVYHKDSQDSEKE